MGHPPEDFPDRGAPGAPPAGKTWHQPHNCQMQAIMGHRSAIVLRAVAGEMQESEWNAWVVWNVGKKE